MAREVINPTIIFFAKGTWRQTAFYILILILIDQCNSHTLCSGWKLIPRLTTGQVQRLSDCGVLRPKWDFYTTPLTTISQDSGNTAEKESKRF